MRATAWPESIELGPGEAGFVAVAVSNTTSVIDAYTVNVFGLDPEWVTITPARLSLFPGDTGNIGIDIRLPDDYPSSQRSLAIHIVSDDDPGAFALCQVELMVPPAAETTVSLDPVMVTGGRRAAFGLIIANGGNAAVTAAATALDPEELAEFTFDPPRILVPPGRDQVIRITAEGGRSWFGQPRARTFELGVDAETHAQALATFIQRPRIPRWLLSLLGLLTAAAVFAAVLSRTFERVVDEARVDDELLNAALAQNEAGGAIVPSNPGTVSGTVGSSGGGSGSGFRAAGGNGLGGVTAELFLADDTSSPVGSAATDDTGKFTFANLGVGDYKLQLSGAGLETSWYPCDVESIPLEESEGFEPGECGLVPVAISADAGVISVTLGNPTPLPGIAVSGEPVVLTGTVDIADPAGATVTVLVPGADGPAVVATVEVGPDGSFVLPDIPTPGTYTIVVEKPGFAPAAQTVTLAPGEGLGDLNIVLSPAAGLITGTVLGPLGPVGGAEISVTDGSQTVETVSLTTADGLGTFKIRELGVPGQYTMTVTKDGFTQSTRAVALEESAPSADVTVQLLESAGSVSGTVTVDGAISQGLQVSISGPGTNRRTDVASQGGGAGTYLVDGLASPGTYTLNFSGPGVIPQARVVSLDPGSITTNSLTGIDADLDTDTTVIPGTVLDVAGNPTAGADVKLTDGIDEWKVQTANQPTLGAFNISGIKPGAYTLTASMVGTEPSVVLVNVTPGTAPGPFELRLGEQASIEVSVLVNGAIPVPPVNVRLYHPDDFPNANAELQRADTDAKGKVLFAALEAPTEFVVAVYENGLDNNPLDSRVVLTQPGQPIQISFDLTP